MKIFYWAPWIGKVGSVKSVMNSANILEKYSKNHIKPELLMRSENGKNLAIIIDTLI